MSAIAAAFACSRDSADRAGVERLIELMAWRGPDARDTWSSGPVALGATLLWSTPEDVGSVQPCREPDGSCAVVVDGRLDNRDELEHALGLAPSAARQLSDAALILAGYRRWGSALPARLVGAYAVAIWDRRVGELLVFRDAVGQRPLFYREVDGTIYVASSLVALRNVPERTVALDEDYLWDFICSNATVGSFDAGATPFAGIRRLPAGHLMTVSARRTHVERWWRPWEQPALRLDDDEAVELFRTTFEKVIVAHLRAVGPVAATLSGGLDSSSIVCMARHLGGLSSHVVPPIHAVTTRWERSAGTRRGYDEGEYVAAVQRRHPGAWHAVAGESLQTFDYFSTSGEQRGEPYLQFSGVWEAMAARATAVGSRVLLSGHGGDALLAGSGFYLADLARSGRFGELARALRGHADRGSASYPLMLGAFVVAPMLPRHHGDRLVRRLAKRAVLGSIDTRYPWSVPAWAARGGRRWQDGAPRLRLLGRRRFRSLAAQFEYERILAGSSDQVRAGTVDAALRHGVEIREPFHDSRLIELALRLPPHLKFADGLTKVVLRRALDDVLPTELIERRGKTSYDFALVEMLTRHVHRAAATMHDSVAARHGLVDAEAARALLAGAVQGGGGNAVNVDALTLLSLEDWLRSLESTDRRLPPAEAARPAGLQPVRAR